MKLTRCASKRTMAAGSHFTTWPHSMKGTYLEADVADWRTTSWGAGPAGCCSQSCKPRRLRDARAVLHPPNTNGDHRARLERVPDHCASGVRLLRYSPWSTPASSAARGAASSSRCSPWPTPASSAARAIGGDLVREVGEFGRAGDRLLHRRWRRAGREERRAQPEDSRRSGRCTEHIERIERTEWTCNRDGP